MKVYFIYQSKSPYQKKRNSMREMYAGNCGNTVSQQMRFKNDDQPATINAFASALAADGSTIWFSSLLPCKDKYYTSPTLTHTFT
jgi:hypothetical protein